MATDLKVLQGPNLHLTFTMGLWGLGLRLISIMALDLLLAVTTMVKQQGHKAP
jgi:hypothetical protein